VGVISDNTVTVANLLSNPAVGLRMTDKQITVYGGAKIGFWLLIVIKVPQISQKCADTMQCNGIFNDDLLQICSHLTAEGTENASAFCSITAKSIAARL